MASVVNNNNDNKESLSEFETIFWKVIHNKYIFKKIFYFIETIEWVKIKHHKIYNPYQIENATDNCRIKFKDIQSMEWMIVNKQYQLLKYKLQYCEKLIKSNSKDAHYGDNYIEINKNAMDWLLKLGVNDDDINKSKPKHYSLMEFESNNVGNIDKPIQQLVNERLILSEILPLILNNKKLEIANMNLIKMSIHNNNITALQILLNETDGSFQTYPSDLEWSIQYSPVSLVSNIIGLSNVIIYPSTKSKSIKLAFKNESHRDEMLKLILDNKQLYNSPSLTTTKTSAGIDYNNETRKKFKSEDGTSINIDGIKNKKLGILSLFKIKSLEIQNKLLDLHYIKGLKSENESSFERLSNSINKILEIPNFNGNVIDRVKEIHKLLAVASNEYYQSYLSLYNEPIDGVDTMVLIEYCLSTFNFNLLSYLLSNEYCIVCLHKDKDEIKEIEVIYSTNSPTPITIEFIKLYLSNLSIFSNQQCDESIDNYILNIGSSKEYEIILNEISNCSSYSNKYPLKWNSILSSINNYNLDIEVTKETIDYFIEYNSNQFIQKIVHEIINEPNLSNKFKSFELVEYTMRSFKDIPTLSKFKLDIGDLFIDAIEVCDLQMLTRITNLEESIQINDYSLFQDHLPYLNGITSQSIEYIIKLLNVFESTNFNCFLGHLFIKLIESICLVKDIGNNLAILSFSLPFNKFKNESIKLLVSSIYDGDNPFKIKLILNNFNPISTTEFNNQWYQHDFPNNYPLYAFNEFTITFFNNEIESEKVIGCIETILYHLNQEIKLSIDGNGDNNMESINIEMYSKIVNFLFKVLISTQCIKLDKIYNVLNLINSTNDNIIKLKPQQQIITIEQSFYNSFKYICIKSVKFQLYLKTLPFLPTILKLDTRDCYYDVNTRTRGYNIGKYLDPTIFTFEYLFGNGINGNYGASFDQVLEKLVYHLSRFPATNHKQTNSKVSFYYNESLNSDLEYYLLINRTDLFFKLLDEIQEQLNDTSFVIGDFPTIIENVQINNDPILIDDGGGNGNDEIELYQQTITNCRIFEFSLDLFNAACISFKESESEFQKFISFCSYYSIVDCLVNINDINVNEHYFNHFSQYQSIINTRYLGNGKFMEPFGYRLFKIQEGSGIGHNSCMKFGLSIDHLIKYENHFISSTSGNNIIDNDKLDIRIINITEWANSKMCPGFYPQFNLVLRQLLSNNFKETELPYYFKITTSMIDYALKFGFIGFLKYFYENTIDVNEDEQFAENDKNKPFLKKYLVDQLSSHYDYKYLNWLIK